MVQERSSVYERAIRDLLTAGYSHVERESRAAGGANTPRSDLIAWGAGIDGEFRPQVSVELKARRRSWDVSFSLALSVLAASAASFGTPVNLVYADGEWLQADPGFINLHPIDGPPECPGAVGILRDPAVLQQFLEAKVWRLADEKRGRSEAPFQEALIEVLANLTRDDEGLAHGTAPGVTAPADATVRAWLRVASAFMDKRSESSTPATVAEAMTIIAGARSGESVFDPFAGFGGLLASVSVSGPPELGQLAGHEISPTAFEVATKLVALSGREANIVRADSRVEPWPASDVIVSVPPFGMRLDEPIELPFARVRELEVAAIAWSAMALKPGGRAVLLTPRGWTFRSGSAASLRSWLASEYRVSGLIGLPAVSPLTGIPLMLVVIDHATPGATVVANLAEDWVEQVAPGTELSQALRRQP